MRIIYLLDWAISIPLIIMSVVMILAGRRMRRDLVAQAESGAQLMAGWDHLQMLSTTTAAYSDALQRLAFAINAAADVYILDHPDVLKASQQVSLTWFMMLQALETAVAAGPRDTPAGSNVQRLPEWRRLASGDMTLRAARDGLVSRAALRYAGEVNRRPQDPLEYRPERI